jgi:hypothetical protein
MVIWLYIPVGGELMLNTKLFRLFLVMSAYLPLFVILAFQHYQGIVWRDKAESFFGRLWDTMCYNLPTIKTPQDILTDLIYVLIFVSVISSFFVLLDITVASSSGAGITVKTIARIVPREQDFISYLITYIPAIVTYNVSHWNELIVKVLLTALILWLSLRTDLLYINPVLMIFQYHLYAIEFADEPNVQYLLISKKSKAYLLKNKTRKFSRYDVENFILVDKKGDSNNGKSVGANK